MAQPSYGLRGSDVRVYRSSRNTAHQVDYSGTFPKNKLQDRRVAAKR